MRARLHRVGRRPTARSQRGAIAILVGLSMAVLIGFVGLAIDGGRLYLTKTELQNAADACALAASYELTGAPNIAADAFIRAEAAGRKVARENKVDFQRNPIENSAIRVRFGTTLDLDDATWTGANGAPGNAKYVRCTIQRSGIAPYFMQVLGFGSQTVNALATASLVPSNPNCAVPMALCAQGSDFDYGYEVGKWYGLDFEDTGGSANYTGNFRWIDFDPSAQTPGCSGGGAQELACLMEKSGQCTLPPPAPGSCSSSGNSNPTPGCVGQNGAVNSMQDAYNTRFGLYKGSGGPTSFPPDFTGYAYSTENWTLGRDAYAGSSGGLPNYKSARTQNLPTINAAGVTPPFYTNPYSPSTQPTHASYGANRRIVVVPIVDCSGFTSGQHAPIRAYACVLLLDPYRRVGNTVKSRVEYLGRSDAPGSPCASSGVPGNATSQGPMVPGLVQ